MKKLLLLSAILTCFMISPLLAQDHLLITEFVVTPTAGEFIEIHNPTDSAIDLSDYYITDATFAGGPTYYYQIVEGGGGGGGFGDFNARFPDGATIAPGEHQTLSLAGSDGFMAEYGVEPTYELFEDGTAADAIPDMREAVTGSINGQGGLSNGGEVVILYYWDGASDLVMDVDYVLWGDKNEAVDKTGVAIDGPDADTDSSTYLDDTPIDDQTVVNVDNDEDEDPHDDGTSAQRLLNVEDLENWGATTPGNGITGHDETSENTSWKGGIWSINTAATPGMRALGDPDSLTIADVNFVRADDIGMDINDDSPFLGDTLSITGVFLQGPREIFLGARWGGFIQAPRSGPWSGFFIIQNDTSAGTEGTLITSTEPGDLIKVTGVMSEFPPDANTASISQFAMITDPLTPIEFIQAGAGLPDPIVLEPGDLGLTAAGTSLDPQLSERWESVLARFEGLTVLDNSGTAGGNTMIAGDETGSIILDDYFSDLSDLLDDNNGVWPNLPAGTQINVTGIVRGGTSQGFITINPRSLDDIEIASSPPVIENITRDPVTPTSSEDATISATITDAQTTVASASITYRVDGGTFQTVDMTASGDTYSGTIPAQANGAFVEYILEAEDDTGDMTILPGDTTSSKFFYTVRDEGTTIFDLQFTPFANGVSGYNGFEVTVTGIVTTDSSDFAFYWIQDGTEPWNGIQVNDQTNNAKLGDEVTVTGTVVESFGYTNISNVTDFTVNSTGNTVPDPVILETGTLTTGSPDAESYEGMLVEVQDVTVTNPFPDGSSNFGEFTIDDGSGGLRVDDLGNFRGNLDSTFALNDQISSVIGIQYFSFGNYKMAPRNDGDIGMVTDIEDEQQIPLSFNLSQNYPNPFNPETTIEYQVPKQGKVTIQIFNILGQKVTTLVDGVQTAGVHQIQWSGRDDLGRPVSTGVYIYRMKAGDFVKVNKMLFLK